MKKIVTMATAAAMLIGAVLFGYPAISSVGDAKAEESVQQQDMDSEEERAEKFREAISKFQQLQDEVNTIQEEAMEAEEVKEALDTFQGILMDKMKTIDENIEEKLESLQELAGEIQSMQLEYINSAPVADDEFIDGESIDDESADDAFIDDESIDDE